MEPLPPDTSKSVMPRFGAIAADPNPIGVGHHSMLGTATLSWESTGTKAVEVRVGAPGGPLLSRSAGSGSATTGQWVRDGMTFFLQDVSDGLPLTAEHTLAKVQVRVRATEKPRGLILLYHRVAEIEPDPWALAVTPPHFAEHLEVLRKSANVLGLRQLEKALLDGALPDRSVAVTFDDGYADNLLEGKPLLERHDVPATVFVTTGAIGRQREFWWDELERVLLQPGHLPQTLSLAVNGHAYQWDLGEGANLDADTHRAQRRWKAWGEADLGSRHMLYRTVYRLLYSLSEGDRRCAQDELLAWAALRSEPGRMSHRTMSSQELQALVTGGLVDVGAHTVTHSLLSVESWSAQRREVLDSKIHLEGILGRPVTSFAYPFGKRDDYTPETVAVVKEAGFACACSNFGGIVCDGVDRFQLPRIYVGDWDGDEFGRQLSSWLDG